jgi:hypothetical protein
MAAMLPGGSAAAPSNLSIAHAHGRGLSEHVPIYLIDFKPLAV